MKFSKRVVSMLLCLMMAVSPAIACKKSGGSKGKGGGPSEETGLSEIIVNNTVRVQLLSESLVRVEKKGAKGFEDRVSFYVSNREDWKHVNYTKTTSGEKEVITTSKVVIEVPSNATGVSSVVIKNKSGGVLWTDKGETTANVYLPSPSDELKSWYFTDSPRVIPSDYGYSAVTNSTGLQNWDFTNHSPDYFIFLPDGDYKQFCQDYTDLTGKSEMVTLQMLGYWDSRWFAYSAETALQQIADYREKGYPIDMLVIDTDWRASSASGIGYDINTTLFPNMAKFLSDCEALGVNIMFNDHPEPVSGTSNLLDKSEVAYRNDKLTMLLSLGLDYWWYDRNWHTTLKSTSNEMSVFAMGMYAYQWITNEFEQGQITNINEYAKRALIMGNVDGCLHGRWKYASDLSAHKYSIQWTGDIGSNKAALEQDIVAAIMGGAEVGLPYVSSDIGGHNAPVTDEMYSRWMQYGAFSSILRVHCSREDYVGGQMGRMPWLFGDEAEEISHEYVDMRYRLLPLYYQLARENYDTGLPIMRRTDIEYPNYSEASRNDQYLLGDSLLVAPIAEAGEKVVPASWLRYDDSGTLKPGLKGSYYNTGNFTGTPQTRIDENIDFEWGTSGPELTGTDNFSIEWNGNITMGEDAKLQFFADDGIEVWVDGVKVIDGTKVYDTLLTTENSYTKDSTHTIRVRFTEGGGNAHVFMYYETVDPIISERTVFIPDGTWIDVWTGEKFAGPQTITVSHSLRTSPLFVREGSVFALAENMESTSEKDWSNMSLDVYPSLTQKGETNIYEDDTTTQGYKDGQFRTTKIESGIISGTTQTIKINKAVGSFTGKLAFTKRNYTVRIHGSLGTVAKVTVGGKNTAFTTKVKDSTASPFAFSGGARDANIYEFIFETDVSKAYEIKITYTNVKTTAVEKPDYDKTAMNFDLTSGVSDNELDITDKGELDWVVYGAASSNDIIKMDGVDARIGAPTGYGEKRQFGNSIMAVNWSNGTKAGGDAFPGISSEKHFNFTLTSKSDKEYFVVYAAGYKCTAKFTVRDRAGNVKTVEFGNLNGEFLERVVIACKDAKNTELYVTYSMLACVPNGTGSHSKLGLIAAYATKTLTAPVIVTGGDANATVEELKQGVTTEVNLSTGYNMTDNTNLDWMHFGWFDSVRSTQKVGGTAITSVNFTEARSFHDYPTPLSWTDGVEIGSQSSTKEGTCTPGTITISLRLPAGVSYVQLFMGAWNSDNTVYVENVEGKTLAATEKYTAGGTSSTRIATIKVESEEGARIVIRIVSTNAHDGGNVSLAALSVFQAPQT